MASEDHDVYDVFTPTTQARLNFIDRPALADSLVDSLRTPGKQLVVFGESGSGKSTLIQKKLVELYEGQITTQCRSDTTFDQLITDAFDQLNPYYEDARSSSRGTTKSASLTNDYFVIKSKLEASTSNEESTSSVRALPLQLTAQRLGQFMGDKKVCWVIEDFHKVALQEKRRLAQTFKIFCDLASEYRFVKIIAIGATGTAREVVECDPEMSKRIAEIHVPLMSSDEIEQVLEGGERLLDFSLGETRSVIALYSVGVASIAHQLALNMCTMSEIYSTSMAAGRVFSLADLQGALRKYISETSDTLKSHFDKALMRKRVVRFDNGRMILTALANGELDGMSYSEIMAEVRKVATDYPSGNLTTYLEQLQREEHGGVIRLDPDGKYRFIDPFHHLYAHLSLNEVNGKKALSSIDFRDKLMNELVFQLEHMLITYSKRGASVQFQSRPRGRRAYPVSAD
jgi:energy-coupling factor transporter ATP-binding protein EcfA2